MAPPGVGNVAMAPAPTEIGGIISANTTINIAVPDPYIPVVFGHNGAVLVEIIRTSGAQVPPSPSLPGQAPIYPYLGPYLCPYLRRASPSQSVPPLSLSSLSPLSHLSPSPPLFVRSSCRSGRRWGSTWKGRTTAS